MAPPSGSAAMRLVWDAVPEPGVAGYNLHYGHEGSRVYTKLIDVGMVTEAPVPDPCPGRIYYCAVTAYNSLGLESEYSDELVFICPTESPFEGPDNRLIVLSSGNDYWLAPTAAVHFEVGTAASYAIWCRMQVADGLPTPLSVSVDGGPELLFHPAATQPSGDPGWFWARLVSANGGPQLFEFSAGAHLLDLRPLGDFEIDRIAMSSDPGFVPSAQLPASGDAVSLTLQPRDRNVVIGGGTTLVAAAVGTDALFFQWYKDGELIPGQTAPILTINPASLADSGSYTVSVWSGTALTTSEATMVQIVAGPSRIKIDNFSIIQDSQVSFQVEGEIGSYLSVYASDDLVNWSLIGGQINADGTVTVADPGAASLPRRFYRLGSNGGEK